MIAWVSTSLKVLRKAHLCLSQRSLTEVSSPHSSLSLPWSSCLALHPYWCPASCWASGPQFWSSDCFFRVQIEALQSHPRSCDPEHLTLRVYTFPTFPSNGRGMWIESMSFPSEHRNTFKPWSCNKHPCVCHKVPNTATLALQPLMHC